VSKLIGMTYGRKWRLFGTPCTLAFYEDCLVVANTSRAKLHRRLFMAGIHAERPDWLIGDHQDIDAMRAEGREIFADTREQMFEQVKGMLPDDCWGRIGATRRSGSRTSRGARCVCARGSGPGSRSTSVDIATSCFTAR
jgi:hypothetical protein